METKLLEHKDDITCLNINQKDFQKYTLHYEMIINNLFTTAQQTNTVINIATRVTNKNHLFNGVKLQKNQ